jgi:hypothetical protein
LNYCFPRFAKQRTWPTSTLRQPLLIFNCGSFGLKFNAVDRQFVGTGLERGIRSTSCVPGQLAGVCAMAAWVIPGGEAKGASPNTQCRKRILGKFLAVVRLHFCCTVLECVQGVRYCPLTVWEGIQTPPHIISLLIAREYGDDPQSRVQQ